MLFVVLRLHRHRAAEAQAAAKSAFIAMVGHELRTPVIAITGAVSTEEVAACREARMTGCVGKPGNACDLYASLFG